MDETEEADLYGDLGDAKMAAATPSTRAANNMMMSTNRQQHSLRPASFAEQVQSLEAQVQQLTKENQTLKRNIGTLYRTARREIDRKDAQLQELQQSLDQQAFAASNNR